MSDSAQIQLSGFVTRLRVQMPGTDVWLAVGVVALLSVLILPLPTLVLDLGLALSITSSVLVLMVALFLQRPLDFSIVGTNLGLGLHPFYALVTDTSGHQYQTQTVWYRLFPAITLTLAVQPAVLSWPATPGSQYAVQSATNLLAGFQTLATLTATNSLAQWPVSHQAGTEFYRVQLLQ